jgi:hypothetical protein
MQEVMQEGVRLQQQRGRDEQAGGGDSWLLSADGAA